MSAVKPPLVRQPRVGWLGDLPEHWEVLELKRDLLFLTSGSRGWADHYSDEGPIFIRIGNLTRDSLRLDFEDIQRVAVPGGSEGERTRVQRGDLLFSITAFLGSVAVVPDDLETAYVSQHVALARLRGRRLDPRWVGYAVLSWVGKTYLASRGYGGTKVQLSLDDVASFLVPAPPLHEQRTLTSFLDREAGKIDALVREQRRLIDLLNEKRQAVISYAVTMGLDPNAEMKPSGLLWPKVVPAHWDVLPLNRVVRQFVDYRGVTPAKLEEGIPLITATQIKNGRIDHTLDPVFISIGEYTERMTRGFPEAGDVLLTTEAPLGEVAMIEHPSVSPGQRMILMKVNREKMTNSFLFNHFRSDFGRGELMMRASGSTASGIRADRLRASAVLVPPKDEQAVISKHIQASIEGFETLEKELLSQQVLLLERRAALISAAVTGKIDVRQVNLDEVAA